MKKIGFMTLIIMATLLFTLAFPAAAAGPKAPPAPAAPAVAAIPAAAPAAAMPDRHPAIHDALESMRAGRRHLEQAEPIFQGHREEAIKHLDMAIHEAEICMEMR